MRRGTDKFKPTIDLQRSGARSCDHPGCTEAAEYRAPRARSRLSDFYWFCLDHVREYNRSWNFCAGMTAADIEREIRSDTCWRRPTWPMGSNSKNRDWRIYGAEDLRDGFGSFYMDDGGERHERATGARRPPYDSPEDKALRVLGLDPSVTLTELKARYKELVKTHHPDRNGGDKLAEERLKDINDAYATLRKCVTA